MRRLTIAASLLVAALPGCSAIGLLNTLSDAGATRTRAAVRFTAATASERAALDVYTPRPTPFRRATPRPIVVFFYGGFWESGARRDYAFVGEALAERGLVAVLPDYRIWPEVRFPAFVEDGARAVAWAQAHAAELGGDPRRVYVMGHSAGAHVASMVALDGRWLRAAAPGRPPVRGMIGLAGLYAFRPADLPFPPAKAADMLAPPAGWAATQPIAHVDPGDPALLLLHGGPDALVAVGNSERLAARAREAGVRVEAKTYPGLGHEAIVAALGRPLRGVAPVLDDVAAWIARDVDAIP